MNLPVNEHPAAVTLDESERADLRDWYDQGGAWPVRMGALYRLVERLIAEHLAESLPLETAWEQGWVARGNAWEVDDNPYTAAPPEPNAQDSAERKTR